MTTLPDSALDLVPVFPLPHVVLFPHARLPLHVFEPRYRKMLADCLAGSRAIVLAQVDGSRIADVAGAGVVVEHQALPDGRSNIIVAGCARVRLEELLVEEGAELPYKRARAVRLADRDVEVSEADRAALVSTAAMFVAEVRRHDPSFRFALPDGPAAGVIADHCAFQLVVDAGVRQAVLEELDPRARVLRVIDQLAFQHAAMLSASDPDRPGGTARGGWGGAPS